MAEFLTSGFGLLLVLFLIILAILWFILPFAIFGIKNRLDLLIAETQVTNRLLTEINSEEPEE